MITETIASKLGAWERKNAAALFRYIDENSAFQGRVYALCHGVKHDLIITAAAVAMPFEDLALLVKNAVGKPLSLLASFFGYDICSECSMRDAWSSVTNVLTSASKAVIALTLLIPNLAVHSCFRILDPSYTFFPGSLADDKSDAPASTGRKEMPSPAPQKKEPASLASAQATNP
jgi:hypothetical protein